MPSGLSPRFESGVARAEEEESGWVIGNTSKMYDLVHGRKTTTTCCFRATGGFIQMAATMRLE
jgi:hypothetical protein